MRALRPLDDRGPLKVMFALTSMPVGGAETLLVNLVRRLDRERFLPEICCLKEPGELGEVLADEIPVHSRLIGYKYDIAVVPRLARLFRKRRIDALVTVGAGDKMFWGRLAAWWAGTPVVLSALHSTGWPDGVGRLNRLLTRLTDGFIGVAAPHGRHLVEREGFPAAKVFVVPNGIDTNRFRPRPEAREALRRELGIPATAPVCGMVAALRPEKNHELFLATAAGIRRELPAAHFVLVGDGPRRAALEAEAARLDLLSCVHFLGTRSDIPEILAGLDLFALTSHIEANPVSILEALAAGVPVVATNVGSVGETVLEGQTGFLVPAGNAERFVQRSLLLLQQPELAQRLGSAGRDLVENSGSLESMVRGYQDLITTLYSGKCGPAKPRELAAPAASLPGTT